jgi:hypothetical protein
MEELKKFLNPMIFVIIIISFFLPFFNITCQQQKIASISGFELITGSTISTNSPKRELTETSIPQNDIIKGVKTNIISPELLALIAFLIAVAGLIFSFFEKFLAIGSTIAGLLGGLLLIFLNSVITDSVLGKINYQPIAVECGTGFYLVIILNIFLIIYNIYLFAQRNMYKPVELHSFETRMRLCPQCGLENDIVSLYCNKCGSRMEENSA